MLRFSVRLTVQVVVTALVAGCFSATFAQQGSIASVREGDSAGQPRVVAALTPAVEGQAVLDRFVAAESKVREALNQHTFKRDVVLQTVGPTGEVTG